MAYENIRHRYPHMVFSDGYFYMFDHTKEVLFCFLQDGRTAFTYPLIGGTLDYQVNSAEFDGFYFWTIEDTGTYRMRIKKWYIENDHCILEDTFDFINDAQHRYQSSAFTVEYYNNTLSTTVSGGSETLYFNTKVDYLDAGDVIKLGPNQDGKHETVTVTGTIGDYAAGINFFTTYEYAEDDPANCTQNIWMFNNYNGLSATGALYKFKYDGTYITHYADAEYYGITCCTFSKVTRATHIDDVSTLLYVRATTLKFLNLDDLSLYTSMTIDSIRSNGVTIIPIYDLAVYGDVIYRLQNRTMYYGVDYVFTDPPGDQGVYNYVLSPILNYIDSITVDADPRILPSNGVNQSVITAAVYDQYGEPYTYGPVSFTDDDPVGFINQPESHTWGDGVAEVYYRAGLDVRTTNIEATATIYF